MSFSSFLLGTVCPSGSPVASGPVCSLMIGSGTCQKVCRWRASIHNRGNNLPSPDPASLPSHSLCRPITTDEPFQVICTERGGRPFTHSMKVDSSLPCAAQDRQQANVPGMLPMSLALARIALTALVLSGGTGWEHAGNPPGQSVLLEAGREPVTHRPLVFIHKHVYLRSRMYSAICSGEVSQSIVSTTFLLSLSPASCLSKTVSCLRSHWPWSRRSNTSSSNTRSTRRGTLSSSWGWS